MPPALHPICTILKLAFAATPVLAVLHACWYIRMYVKWQGERLRTLKHSSSKATSDRKLACRARGSPGNQSSPLHVPAYLREGHAAHDALAKMKAAKQVTWKQVGHRAEL